MTNVLDPVSNFAIATLTAGIDIDDTAFSVGAGEGALFPAPATAGAFNVVIWNYTDYRNPSDDPNKEIVRVSARTTDAFTITRAQEDTIAATHNTADKVYKIILTPTKKQRDDIESNFGNYVLKSLYDAYSILMATTDNTPVAITVAEQTIVGRKTSGAITALTASEVRTILNVADGANAYTHPNHSGDVTSVADGAQTIANEAVTYAKMQHISATDKVLGRATAGAGDVEEIACTAAGRALLDDATAADQRTTLGLGTMATATATDYVAKSLYDANSILYATADNTPLALTVGASTIVGRKATGDIVALTATELRTIINVADGATANAKAIGSEVDTGTDDTKFLTVKSVNDSHNVPMVAPGTSGNLLTSNGTDWTSAAPAGGGSLNYVIITKADVATCYTDAHSNGTVSYAASGLNIATSATQNSYQKVTSIIGYGVVPFFDWSPVFSCAGNVRTAGTDYQLFFGLGNVAITGTAHTFTNEHSGFKIIAVSSTAVLSATNAEGTTETATDITSGITVTDPQTWMTRQTGSTNIKYYVCGVLKATHTTNLPTGDVNSSNIYLQASINNSNVAVNSNALLTSLSTQFNPI